jgi:predicted DsbA family dithiol-disulfide isomerase
VPFFVIDRTYGISGAPPASGLHAIWAAQDRAASGLHAIWAAQDRAASG